MMHTTQNHKPVRRLAPHVTVVFTGASGSGKTTLRDAVFDLLASDATHRLYPVKESFAKPLKLLLTGLDKTDPRFRPIAQQVGDAFRAENEDYFVEKLKERVEERPMECVVLVDDGRRLNEGQVADIVVRLVTHRQNRLTPEQRAHVSETEWERIGATLTFTTDDETTIERDAMYVASKITAFAAASEEE